METEAKAVVVAAVVEAAASCTAVATTAATAAAAAAASAAATAATTTTTTAAATIMITTTVAAAGAKFQSSKLRSLTSTMQWQKKSAKAAYGSEAKGGEDRCLHHRHSMAAGARRSFRGFES